MTLDKNDTKKSDFFSHELNLFDVFEIPVIAVDRSFTIRGLNYSAEKFAGMPSETCIGQDYRTIFCLEDTINGRSPIEQVMELAVPHAGDAIAQVNGISIPVKYGASPIFDNIGQVHGVIKYIVDQRQKGVVDEIVQLTGEIQNGNLTARADPISFDGDARTILEGVNNILDAIVDPLTLTASYVDRISRGDIPPKIITVYNGDFNEIKNNLNQCIDTIRYLISDINLLNDAGVNGNLDTRTDTTKYQGDFKTIAEGVNNVLESFLHPLKGAANYIGRISKGDIPEKITKSYNGDFNEIKNNLNALVDLVQMRNADIQLLIQSAIEGNLDVRVDSAKYPGEDGVMIDGINKMLDAILIPIREEIRILKQIEEGNLQENVEIQCAGDHQKMKDAVNGVHAWFSDLITYVNQIAKGDLSADIAKASDQDQIHESLILMRENIKALVDDVTLLSDAAVEGKLDTRADATNHQGDFRKIVEGVNDTLDAIINPLNVSAEYIDRISKGDIPPKIIDEYQGNFNEIKNNLNTLIDVVHLRNDDINLLSTAALEGRLDVRADISRYTGYHGGLIDKMNKILDSYLGPVNVSAEYIDRISKGDIPPKITDSYNGDFNEIKNNLNTLIDVVHLRNDDINLLSTAALEGRLDVRADISRYTGYHGGLIDKINKILDSYLGPINVSAEYIDRISKGDIPSKITDSYNGDFNEIKNNLNTLIDVVLMRNVDIKMLIQAAVDGKLDVRADSGKYLGENGKMLDGINHMLDAYLGPINVSAEYIDRISKGDIPPKITDSYNGDFNEIKNNLNTLIDVVHMRNDDIRMLIQAAVDGRLDVRADSSKYQGENGKMLDGINHMLDAYIGPINVSAEYIDRISKGDIPPKITDSYNGDFNEIKNNLNTLIDVVHMRNDDIRMLIQAAVDGRLDVRADSAKYQGENGKMLDGINHMLDAYLGPINVSAEYIDRISKGDIPPKITDSYNGDFNEIKNNLNALIDVVLMRNVDIKMLIQAAIDGKLDVRADSAKYQGENGKMLDGINHMLDAYLGPINVSAEYIDRISKGDIPPKITDSYNGDFNEIKNNLNTLIDVVLMRNVDIKMLIQAALDGRLDVRADSSKYQGENGKMLDGINHMLDAYLGPLNVAAEYMDHIAKGDIPPRITDSYNGDFNEIKNNLNICIDAVNLLISDTHRLSDAAALGKLRTRADPTKHQGDFRKIVEGVNSTLDAVITPFQVVNKQIDHIAASSEEATASLEEVAAGANEVTKSSDQVSANTDLCNNSLLQVLSAMNDFSVTVGQVSGKADSVSKISYAASQLCVEGANIARKAEQGMEGITRSTVEVSDIVKDIKNQMQEIGKIVNLISDISSQTNLLALNAAIEAARAGEAGRGFAVVAAEVKSLAQESRKSAENIADMINGLQQKSQAAADAMETADSDVKMGNEAMKETLHIFARIVDSVGDISKNIEEVASASEEQAASVQEITASINEVSSLVKKTAKEAQNSSDTTREATVAIDQISHVVGDLCGIVDTLSYEIGKFEI